MCTVLVAFCHSKKIPDKRTSQEERFIYTHGFGSFSSWQFASLFWAVVRQGIMVGSESWSKAFHLMAAR